MSKSALHVHVSKTALLPALEHACKLFDVPDPNTEEVGGEVIQLRCQGADLFVEASTGDVVLSAPAAHPIVLAAGVVQVHAGSLHTVVAKAPENALTLRAISAEGLTFCEVTSGTSVYRIICQDGWWAPAVPAATFMEIDGRAFDELLGATLYAACHDETRWHLCGVLLESDGATMTMVATDGHRLAVGGARAIRGPRSGAGVIVPRPAAAAARRLLERGGTCRIAFTPTWFWLEAGGASLAAKLVDRTFPPYKLVIPTKRSGQCTIDAATEATALERIILPALVEACRREVERRRLTAAHGPQPAAAGAVA